MKKQILIAAMALTTLAACQSDVNPLLVDWNTPYQTPPFNEIKVDHYAPAFDVAIAEARAEIDAIVADTAAPTFANTIEALERAGSKLTRIEYIFFNILEADAAGVDGGSAQVDRVLERRIAQPRAVCSREGCLRSA